MKLTVLERLILLQNLPQEGSFVTLKILRSLKSNLALSEVEYKDFEVKQNGEQIVWNKKGEEEVEIEIGEKATDMAIIALKELNDNKKLTEQHFSLYEKFIEGA